jgi:hypothetical protein
MKFYVAPFYSKEQLAMMNESEMHFPFSDDDATYNGLFHQYELTEKYFLERGVNLQQRLSGNDPEKVKHFLEELRTKFYTRIYNTNKTLPRKLNYMIAKRGIYGISPYEYRQLFLQAMFIEGKYLDNNGDISSVSGVDFDTMQNMSADVIRHQERDFHKDAIDLLKTLGLRYYGEYRFIPQGEDW